MIAIGIDPGVSGAIPVLRTYTLSTDGAEDQLGLELICDLPTMQRGKTGAKQQINGRELTRILIPFCAEIEDVHIYLELVKGLPRGGAGGTSMGSTSAFNFGHTFGMIQGVIEALEFAYTLVPPEQWKKRAGLLGAKAKDASRTRALQLFPFAASQLTRKKDVGRAEALLIAHYGPQL